METHVKGYKFTLSQSRDEVALEVEPEGRDAKEEDEKWVREYFADMGKWEAVANAIQNLLSPENKPSTTLHDPSEYVVDIAERGMRKLTGSVCLSQQERWARTGWVRGASCVLPLEEVQHQMQNVEKWRNLKKSLGWLLERA